MQVLNLPSESLTKEIALTQSLLDLFIEFQIPSDLLSYDGESSQPAATKLQAVKEHVKAIDDMIAKAKASEVAASKQQAAYAHPRAPVAEEEMADDDGNEGIGAAMGGAQHSVKRYKARARSSNAHISMLARSTAAAVDVSVERMPAASAVMMNDEMPTVEVAAKSATPAMPTPATSTTPVTPSAHPPSATPPIVDGGKSGSVDYTTLPQRLDAAYGELDVEAAIRPTRIDVGAEWSRSSQPALLAARVESTVDAAEQRRAQRKAFDLLDALTRSGALSFDAASLHVLVAATHVFDLALTETVISDNVNPIEKLERSSLLISSIIHDASPGAMLSAEHSERAAQLLPVQAKKGSSPSGGGLGESAAMKK